MKIQHISPSLCWRVANRHIRSIILTKEEISCIKISIFHKFTIVTTQQRGSFYDEETSLRLFRLSVRPHQRFSFQLSMSLEK